MVTRRVVHPIFLASALMKAAGAKVAVQQAGVWTVFTFSSSAELHLTTCKQCSKYVDEVVPNSPPADFLGSTDTRPVELDWGVGVGVS